MGIPISVGDAILLSQIAWSIGEAFTSGRKSAPAEFAEIQDLLFTLGEALKVLAKDLPVGNQVAQAERVADGQADNAVPEADDALLAQMILNCRSTLTYLKAMVDRYMELDKNDGQRGQKKWKDEVKKNWKKLLWTKEGGDIIKLKTTLSAHINGLNLALSAINKRYGREVKSHVEGMHTKLDSIYEWFKQNLQGQQAATASASPQYHLGSEVQNHGGLWFSVSIQIMPGREYMNLHCPRATFRDNWLDDKDPFRVAPSIFQCCCSRNSTALDHAESLHVSLLPSSLLVQVATLDSEPPRWHMYAASRSTPHRISSIYISEVEPTNLQDFEAAASCLSLVQARQHLLRNQTTRLVSFNATAGSSSDEYSDGIVSVLASKTEQVPEYDEGTCTLLFTVGERQFRAAADSAYSVLHYKSMPEGAVRQAPSDTSFSKPEDTSRGGIPLSSAMDFELQQPHAEVLFQETNKMLGGGGDSTYYISFHHNTTISRGSGRRTICLHDILVVSEQKTDSSHSATIQQIKCTSVDVEFGESTEAQAFLSSLQAMQSNLFHLHLTRHLFGDHILFQRFAGDMVVQDQILPCATLSLVYSPKSDTYRVILISDTRAASVCLPLEPRHLEALITDPSARRKLFSGYFLVKDGKGREVVRASVRFDEVVGSGEIASTGFD